MIPRFGIELVVSPGLESLAWYGRGPVETYVDRAVRARRRLLVDGAGRVGGVLAAAGEREQDRRAVGGTDAASGIGLLAEGVPTLSVSARARDQGRHRGRPTTRSSCRAGPRST